MNVKDTVQEKYSNIEKMHWLIHKPWHRDTTSHSLNCNTQWTLLGQSDEQL